MNTKTIKLAGFVLLCTLFSITVFSKNLEDAVPIEEQEMLAYPVLGPLNDTIFNVYIRSGSLPAEERAQKLTERIEKLYDNDFFNPDSIKVTQMEDNYEIVYEGLVIMSLSEQDAKRYSTTLPELANNYALKITNSIKNARSELSWQKYLIRFGWVFLVICVLVLSFFGVQKLGKYLLHLFQKQELTWIKDYTYKDYTFLTVAQQLQAITFIINLLKWLFFLVLLYIALPVIFSIFPFSENWADALFGLVWNPLKEMFVSFANYIPNLITIVLIIVVMRYLVGFVKYFFNEIGEGKLKFVGFHPDWASPTYTIVRILLISFTLVVIFPYLPGSDSNIFKGVSVFLGILFSLGSSTAVANMVAGILITYMRPFKVGDRIKIGEFMGDVFERSILVTRIKTIKNEIITIPNSTVLNGSSINYSDQIEQGGLIVNTTITIGYNVPWREVHAALIHAALRTDYIEKEPKPFVFQTSLDDFYVSYQINAFTKEPNKQGSIYSELHQNIQDVCIEQGIVMVTPHYESMPDGHNYYANDPK